MSKEKNNTDNTINSSTDRRKVLKGAVTGSAIAGAVVWKKPVIDAVLTPAHAQTSAVEISLQAVVTTGDDIADDLQTITVDTGNGGTTTLSNSDVSDDMSMAFNVTVTPAQSIPVTLSWTNTDNIDAGPSSPAMVQTFDNGTGSFTLVTDDLPDNSGTDAMATFTATAAGVTDNAVVTLDFS